MPRSHSGKIEGFNYGRPVRYITEDEGRAIGLVPPRSPEWDSNTESFDAFVGRVLKTKTIFRVGRAEYAWVKSERIWVLLSSLTTGAPA